MLENLSIAQNGEFLSLLPFWGCRVGIFARFRPHSNWRNVAQACNAKPFGLCRKRNLDRARKQNQRQCRLSHYFLVDGIPWRVISRSARSATPACSPIASRRIRSWQGWQIPPLITSAGLAQIMHFLLGSFIIKNSWKVTDCETVS